MKKKLSSFLLAVLLCLLTAACGPAPTRQEATLPGDYPMELLFSSGAGAWRTLLTLNADGTFTGEYSDSDMGDMDDTYPNGTLYLCSFSGRFEVLSSDGYATSLRLAELTCKDEPGRTELVDGVRRIYSEPIGLYVYEEERLAENLILYTPDTPVATLDEEMLYWWPGHFKDVTPDTLECCALWSPESGAAFFSCSEFNDF